MRSDAYLPGALVLAYALRAQSRVDLVCLVTQDISPRAHGALAMMYDRVILIDEWHKKRRDHRPKRPEYTHDKV